MRRLTKPGMASLSPGSIEEEIQCMPSTLPSPLTLSLSLSLSLSLNGCCTLLAVRCPTAGDWPRSKLFRPADPLPGPSRVTDRYYSMGAALIPGPRCHSVTDGHRYVGLHAHLYKHSPLVCSQKCQVDMNGNYRIISMSSACSKTLNYSTMTPMPF